MDDTIYFPAGEPVTVIRAGSYVDPASGETEGQDWDSPTETTYEFCAVGHGPSDESWMIGRNPADVVLTVYMPYDADVTRKDRVRVRGTVYDVNGDPFRWASPFTGDEEGTEVYLQERLG